MTKIQTFRADEGKRDALRQALPVVLEALEAVKEGLETGRTNQGVIEPNVGNAYFQQIVGARYIIQKLPDLIKLEEDKPVALKGRRQSTQADIDTLKEQQEGN